MRAELLCFCCCCCCCCLLILRTIPGPRMKIASFIEISLKSDFIQFFHDFMV